MIPARAVILLTGTPLFLDAPHPLVRVMNKPFDSSALAASGGFTFSRLKSYKAEV